MLIANLPADAATVLASRGPDSQWRLTDLLLASVVDHLAAANWQRGNAGVKQGKQTPRPEPVPRPGVKTKTTARLSDERIRAGLLDLKRRTEGR